MIYSKKNNNNKQDSIKVLIVENNAKDYLLQLKLLEEAGAGLNWSFDQVSNYIDADALIRKNNYDLVLLDYNLDYYTGLDLVKQIHVVYNIDMPTVMITENTDPGMIKEAKSLGLSHYIAKDELNSSSVKNLVEKYFKKSETKSPLFASDRNSKEERVKYFEGFNYFMDSKTGAASI